MCAHAHTRAHVAALCMQSTQHSSDNRSLALRFPRAQPPAPAAPGRLGQCPATAGTDARRHSSSITVSNEGSTSDSPEPQGPQIPEGPAKPLPQGTQDGPYRCSDTAVRLRTAGLAVRIGMRRYFLSAESLALPPHTHTCWSLSPSTSLFPLLGVPQAVSPAPQLLPMWEAEAQVRVANGQVSWVGGGQTTLSYPNGPQLPWHRSLGPGYVLPRWPAGRPRPPPPASVHPPSVWHCRS